MIAVIAVGAAACEVRENRYIRANERVIAQLPLYPGAVAGSQVRRTGSFDDYEPPEGDLGIPEIHFPPPDGWQTSLTYRLPRRIDRRRIASFYERWLRAHGWFGPRCHDYSGRNDDYYTRGDAEVIVILGHARRLTDTVVLSVDSQGAKRACNA
jgi:hypothetical protein